MSNQDTIEERLKQLERKVFLVNKDIFDLKEVSVYTGYKESYIYKLTSSKEIPCYSPSGHKLFFYKKDIDEWLLSNKSKEKNKEKTFTEPLVLPKISKPTLKVILDTRIEKTNNTFAVKLRVTYNRVSHYCNLQMYFTKEDWAEIKKGKEINKFSNHTMHKILVEAEKILSKQRQNLINFKFSFEDFSNDFLKLYFEKFNDTLSKYVDDSKLFTLDDMLDFALFCYDIKIKPTNQALNAFLNKHLYHKLI